MRDGYYFSDNEALSHIHVLIVRYGRGRWLSSLDGDFLEVEDGVGWGIAESDPIYKHYYLVLPVEFTLSTEAEEGDGKDVSA